MSEETEIIEIPHERIPHYVESQKREEGYILRDGINVPSKYIKR